MRILFLALLALPHVTHAAAPAGGEPFPCSTTAYYSPLLGQDFYLNGSYADEIRMNGEGTHAADGTPVGHGLLAAPGSFAFGTPVYIPGFGMGEVHDRGGKIIDLEDGAARLDIWLGHGDEGLKNAMNWGFQHGTCYRYPVGSHAAMNVTPTPESARVLTRALAEGSRGEDVRALQNLLQHEGFLKAPATAYFGPKTAEALTAYQLYNGIIVRATDEGAGDLGPMTQQYAESDMREIAYLSERGQAHPFVYTRHIYKGYSGDDVRHLQSRLAAADFMDHDITEFYGPNTAAAVTKLQLREGIITAPHQGGHVGPSTLAYLNDMKDYAPQNVPQSPSANAIPSVNEPANTPHVFYADAPITGETLTLGDTGERVKLLQQILHNAGYLNIRPNGFFGAGTEAALIEYQVMNQIIPHPSAHGNGVFGPATQAHMQPLTAPLHD